MPDGTDPLDEPTNEELSAALQARLGGGDDSVSESEPASETEESGEGEGEPTPPVVETTPPPTDIEYFDLGDGNKLSREDAVRYQQFEQFLLDNPDFVTALQGISSGELELVKKGEAPPPTQVEIPDGVDLDDPNIKFLYERLQAANEELQSTKSKLTEHEQQITNQSRSTLDSLFNKARDTFQSERGLSPEEMQKVVDTAGGLNILPGLLSRDRKSVV